MKKLVLPLALILMLLNACGMTPITITQAPTDGQYLKATVEMQATWLSYLSTRDGVREIKATVEALATQNAYLSTAIVAQNTRGAPAPVLNTSPTAPTNSGQMDTDSMGAIWVYPSRVQTGIPEVDAVIEAVLTKDTGALQGMVRYTTFECTTDDGLGGPPKCEPGETDGTPVQALPIADVEGHYSRPEQIERTLDFITKVKGLLAVYRVIDNAYDASWPSGQYAIIFLQDQEQPSATITLRVEDGWIVRLDYKIIASTDEEIEWPEGTVVLPPAR